MRRKEKRIGDKCFFFPLLYVYIFWYFLPVLRVNIIIPLYYGNIYRITDAFSICLFLILFFFFYLLLNNRPAFFPLFWNSPKDKNERFVTAADLNRSKHLSRFIGFSEINTKFRKFKINKQQINVSTDYSLFDTLYLSQKKIFSLLLWSLKKSTFFFARLIKQLRKIVGCKKKKAKI